MSNQNSFSADDESQSDLSWRNRAEDLSEPVEYADELTSDSEVTNSSPTNSTPTNFPFSNSILPPIFQNPAPVGSGSYAPQPVTTGMVHQSTASVGTESNSAPARQNSGGNGKTIPLELGEMDDQNSRHLKHGGIGLFWILFLMAIMLAGVFAGPKIVEQYSYAYAKGKARGEYELAKVALSDRPLEGISAMYELIAKKITPSVVHIETISKQQKREGLVYQRDTKGQGSGVIFSQDGFIVTNYHVVMNTRSINVTLADRRVFSADVVGTDEQTDLAVLKINSDGLIPGEWANDNDINVGTMAWAFGSPFGLDGSVTSGIISGRHRRVKSPQSTSDNDYVFKDLIQTDAAINPGNSGGPLVNSTGKIMGINTSIIGGSYQGVCFSVPSSIVQFVVEQIIENGRVERGFLGVFPEMVSYDYARENGIDDFSGALVSSVQPGTPAFMAGIQKGDIIRRWNDTDVESELTLFSLVAAATANSRVNLVIFRDGVELTKPITIASRDEYSLAERTIRSRPNMRRLRND